MISPHFFESCSLTNSINIWRLIGIVENVHDIKFIKSIKMMIKPKHIGLEARWSLNLT